MDECDGRPMNTALKDIYANNVHDLWHVPVIRWFVIVMSTIGTTIIGISTAYILTSNPQTDTIYLVLAAGVCFNSFLIVILTWIVIIRVCICITSPIGVDSTPTARAPAFAADDMTGRPKSNSPLSVLHAV